MQFPTSIIQLILSMVSFEYYVYFFPVEKSVLREYHPYFHTFSWAINAIEHPLVQKSMIHWLMRNNILEGVCPSLMNQLCRNKQKHEFFKLVCGYLNTRAKDILIIYTRRSVDVICKYGFVGLLEWWFNFCSQKNLLFFYTSDALDFASTFGYVEILEWWESNYASHNLTLRYSRNAIDKTFSVHVLNWWLKMHQRYGIALYYSAKAIDSTLDTELLDWWLNAQEEYSVPMKYNRWSIINACAHNDLKVLDWWFYKIRAEYDHIPLKYSETAVDLASGCGQLQTLNWWFRFTVESKTPLQYSHNAVDYASENGHVDVLQWWWDHRRHFAFKYTHKSVDRASKNGHIQVLNWWWYQFHLKHGEEFKFSMNAVEVPLEYLDLRVLLWWANVNPMYLLKFSE